SLAKAQQLPFWYEERNNRMVILQRLGYHNRPVYYATDNADAASIISADKVWTGEGGLPSLSGEGVEINVWDGGAVLDTHRKFAEGEDSRVYMRDLDIPVSNHSTHVAGTMVAAGIEEDARGMARMATVYGWDFSNDITEMAIAALEGIVVSNHSYGPLCGWYYNSTNERWYWYGDPEISAEEDYQFGFYDEVSADMDYIAWCTPNYLIVKSAGNDRNDAPDEQPISHLVWDVSWQSVTAERDEDGGEDGYDCLTPMAVPKNIITVGAVDDNKLITSFSAFGPTDDGRIKPDVVASGADVYSSIGSSDQSYAYMNGTSMSAASVTGSISLLLQLQQLLQPGVNLLSSTMKGLLIHTADESGTSAGPDYRHGWGILNIKEAADLMQSNFGNGGRNIYEGSITEGESAMIPVEITTPSPGIKITLCWIDPPGPVSEAELNPVDGKLVNDLDLELILPGSQPNCFPWVLDAAHPDEPATQGVNHVDNVEQLFLPDPATGIYQVKISHSGSLAEGNQSYSLIISGISTPTDILPPSLLQLNTGPSSVALKWTSAKPGLPAFYRIYRNAALLATTADTIYSDIDIEVDKVYDYYVTAVYNWGGHEVESVATNTVTATPRTLRPLPLFIDFEEGHSDMLIKDSYDGWRWGDSESLSSYYLIFQENTTHFIGIDSYSSGVSSHVNDVAATLPLKLAGSSDVTISFDYMFITGIYDAIDELYVMYKMQDQAEWQALKQIPKAVKWTQYSLLFPDELCKDGIQIGFYYDDLYQSGMGAGLDNINIAGETSRSIDLAITSMISPVSACMFSDAEPVSISIMNAGEEEILPSDVISLQMIVSPGIQVEEDLVLTETLHSGDVLIYQMGTLVDLSETGTYTFGFLLSSDLDKSVLNNSLTSIVEATDSPLTRILNQDLLVCEEEEPILIQCSPEGGTLTGPGVTGLYFDPGAAGIGLHTLTYIYTDLIGCQGTASAEFEVLAQPMPIILNNDLSFCEGEPPVLIQCSPEGGTLSGPGVTGLYFNPGASGAGLHTLTYLYTDPNGCQGIATVGVEVLPRPKTTILNEDLLFCEEDAPVLILCSPAGGTLYGPGVTGLYFDPGTAGEGVHTLSYVYTDPFGCQGSASAVFEVVAQPKPIILNEDLSFCEDESSVLIQAIPEGGTLTGPGVTGLYFDPQEAGIGRNSIFYKVIYRGECVASTTRDFFVTQKPLVDLGSDRQIELDDTIELLPTGNGVSYLWFDASTEESKLIIANNLGLGNHNIWVEAFSPEQCSAVDTMLLSIGETTGISINDNISSASVYPNPFRTGFNLEFNKSEIVEKVSLLDLTGRIHSNNIPASYPYFHVPNLPAGIYLLKVETREHIYLIRIVKI
ncbi:MAG: T9SS type A sorting domain-containing protein, partial [Bacteroidia bacterium]